MCRSFFCRVMLVGATTRCCSLAELSRWYEIVQVRVRALDLICLKEAGLRTEQWFDMQVILPFE